MDSVTLALSKIYECIFVSPIRKLYYYGPSFMGVGFWEGMPNVEICAKITGYTEFFWQANQADCTEMINAKFYSFQISVEVLLYFLIVYRFLKNFIGDFSRAIKDRLLCSRATQSCDQLRCEIGPDGKSLLIKKLR